MWYEKAYRRNLVDMHIEDWSPEFLSKFSVDDYYNNLVEGKIQAPMIYLQSHVGHCNWPTRTGHMHRALVGKENFIRKLIDKCRANGMSVVGYYSLIYNAWANDVHPEWAILDVNGKNNRQKGGRHGLSCPNNPGYREFTFKQIAEMAEYFTVDGMFYDMLFWPGICYCEHCKKRFKDETGYDFPMKQNWHDPAWLALIERRIVWMGEFAQSVTDETKRLMPGVSVEHNYASAVAGNVMSSSTELVNAACDYTGGDLYGDLYNHSFTAKYYYGVTKNQPFEYMTGRCNPNLQQHTVTKTKEALTLEIMLTAAHHGASFIIDAIDPRGTLDARVYKRVGEVFDRQIGYEQYFKGKMVGDAAVYYSTTNRYNADEQPIEHKLCAINTVKTLIENHVPVEVLSDISLDKLGNYRFVFAPALNLLTDERRGKLVEYVKNGGSLYFSGACEEKLLYDLIGGKTSGLTESTRTFLAPKTEAEYLFPEFNAAFPLPFEVKLPIVSLDSDDGVLATITLPYTNPTEQKFASVHSNPPGVPTKYPAVVVKKLGRGTVIWSAAPIELDQRIHFRRILMNLARLGADFDNLTVKSTASKKVELVTFRTDGSWLVSAVDLECTEELLARPPFTVSVKTTFAPQQIVRLPDRTPIPFAYENGYATFKVDSLVMFDMFEIK